MSKAPDFLKAALSHMEDRAATYDKPEGERSMPKVVAAFNAITEHKLTAEQGWLFAVLLKAVRAQQGDFRADNYEDGAAYFALMGEQAVGDRGLPLPVLPYVEESAEEATHCDGGGYLYKKSVLGLWLQWSNGAWFSASLDPAYEPTDLIKL